MKPVTKEKKDPHSDLEYVNNIFARDLADYQVRYCKVCSPPDDEKKEIL